MFNLIKRGIKSMAENGEVIGVFIVSVGVGLIASSRVYK